MRDYLPEIAVLDEARFPPLATVAEALGGAEISPLPIADDCSDGFLCAYWKRPLAYLDAAVRANISSLAVLPPDVLEPAMARLERDIADGTLGRAQRRPARARRARLRLPPARGGAGLTPRTRPAR